MVGNCKPGKHGKPCSESDKSRYDAEPRHLGPTHYADDLAWRYPRPARGIDVGAEDFLAKSVERSEAFSGSGRSRTDEGRHAIRSLTARVPRSRLPRRAHPGAQLQGQLAH